MKEVLSLFGVGFLFGWLFLHTVAIQQPILSAAEIDGRYIDLRGQQ